MSKENEAWMTDKERLDNTVEVLTKLTAALIHKGIVTPNEVRDGYQHIASISEKMDKQN